MLNEWIFDARLMEQQVTRLFILFHTDWPCSFAGRDFSATLWSTPLTRTFYSSVSRLSLVRRLFVVRLSVVCALSLALYILKSGIPLQGHRPTATYDYSVRTNHVNANVNGFFRGVLFLIQTLARRLFRLHFWYMPLSIIGSFPFILY